MKYNHELLDYGFIEGVEFEPLMPAAAEKIGVVGGSNVIVEEHGRHAKGMDSLEVVDIEAAFTAKSAEGTAKENAITEKGTE